MNTVISALRSHLIFESLDVQPVPGEEENRAVNLYKVRCMNQRRRLGQILLTRGLRSMCQQREDLYGERLTVKVGTVLGYRWDQ